MFLYGASGHAKVIIDILTKNNTTINGIFDDNPEIKELNGLSCFGAFNLALLEGAKLIISIGDNKIRKKIATELENSVFFGNAIDSSAIIANNVSINKGTVIMPNTVINTDSYIGKQVIINTLASIDHECIIGDFVHISPNATLCGNVTIGEGTHFGAAAVAIPGVKIGKWCTIGAGAVIINDIPDYAVAVGNPARIIKYNIINE